MKVLSLQENATHCKNLIEMQEAGVSEYELVANLDLFLIIADIKQLYEKFIFPEILIRHCIKTYGYSAQLIQNQIIPHDLIVEHYLCNNKFEFYKLVLKYQYIPEDHIIELMNNAKFSFDKTILVDNCKFSETFINKYYPNFNYNDLLCSQTIPESLYTEKYLDVDNSATRNKMMDTLLRNQKLSETFILNHVPQDKYFMMMANQQLSEEFLTTLIGDMGDLPNDRVHGIWKIETPYNIWDGIIIYQVVSVDFINRYIEKFKMQHIIRYQKLDSAFLVEYHEKFNSDYWFAVLKYQDLAPEVFAYFQAKIVNLFKKDELYVK